MEFNDSNPAPEGTCSFRRRRSSAGRDRPIPGATSSRSAGSTTPTEAAFCRWNKHFGQSDPPCPVRFVVRYSPFPGPIKPRPPSAKKCQSAITLQQDPATAQIQTVLAHAPSTSDPANLLRAKTGHFMRVGSPLISCTPRHGFPARQLRSRRRGACRQRYRDAVSLSFSETLANYVENVLIRIELVLTCSTLRI